MKKRTGILILLITTLVIISQSCAWEVYRGFFGSFTKCSIIGGESWNDPVGVQLGVSGPYTKIGESAVFGIEAGISAQGAKWKEGDLEGRTNLLYFNLPLVFQYQLQNGLFAEAGLQPGLLLSAKDKYEGSADNYMDHMNRFDLSVPLGIGYQFKNSIGVRCRVIPGLNDITKDEDEKDRNFIVGLGITYTLKGK